MSPGVLAERIAADLGALVRGFEFERPEALWLLAASAAVLAWGAFNARAGRRMAPPALRALVLALFAIALANPEVVTRSEGTTLPVVVDGSASMTPTMRRWSAELLTEQLGYRSDDPVIVFAADAVGGKVGEVAAQLREGRPCDECRPEATDIGRALERLAADAGGEGGRAVLVTDGWENRGDAERALGRLAAARIRLDVFTPPRMGPVPNVAVTQLTIPATLDKAQAFALGVTLENQGDAPVSGRLRVTRGGQVVDERRVTVAPGAERIEVAVRADQAGLESFAARFRADEAKLDIHPQDNELRGWVGVGGQRKALILSGSARDARYLETVTRRLGVAPTVYALDRGQWNGDVRGFDAVMLNNVPAERIAPAAQRALAAYVERGGSLAMVGGDESFGLGGWELSPVAPVMPVVMRPPQRQEPTRALVLVIDKSGSMLRRDGGQERIQYAKAAALTVARTLRDEDQVAVIGFDSQAFVVLPLGPLAQHRPHLEEMIGRLVAQGQTFLLPALQEAERTLARARAQVKHVVVLTDGETGGTTMQYYDLVSRMRRELGATISTIAVGRRTNEALLKSISQFGGGAYYQTDSARNLPEIFVEDVQQHAGQSTMVEAEFTPQSVKPDPVLKDYAGRALPPLKGYVSTELKPRATMSVYVERDGKSEPVIASWRRGAGKALAVTTDASGRWSSEWIEARVFTPIWERLLRWMTPEAGDAQKMDVALGYRNGEIQLKLTDYADRPEASGHLVKAVVTRPDGSRTQTVLTEAVAGEFSATIEAPEPGTYQIDVVAEGAKGGKLPPLAYTVSEAVRAEVPRPTPNYALLEQLTAATGGRLNPSAAEIALGRPVAEQRTSLAPYPIVLAMLLLIGEALARRLTA